MLARIANMFKLDCMKRFYDNLHSVVDAVEERISNSSRVWVGLAVLFFSADLTSLDQFIVHLLFGLRPIEARYLLENMPAADQQGERRVGQECGAHSFLQGETGIAHSRSSRQGASSAVTVSGGGGGLPLPRCSNQWATRIRAA